MSAPELRKWFIGRALRSYTELTDVIDELTEAEVLACLDLESASRRRRSVIDRLISRAIRLKEIEYNQVLKLKYCDAE